MPDTPERRPSDVAPPATRATEPAIHGADGGGAEPSVADSVKAQASAAGEDVREQAGRWAEDARSRGKHLLDQQRSKAAEQLADIAQALQQSADRCLQQEDQRAAGRTLQQAASGLDRVSGMLREHDVDSMLDQAANLTRRQPALFIGGTIAAGFLLSRFLKSSSEHSQQASWYDREQLARQADASAESTDDRGTSYVTDAHVDPDEVPSQSPIPSERRDH